MKRVLFVISRMNTRMSGGQCTFMRGSITEIQRQGHYCDIATDGDPFTDYFKENNIRVFTPPIRSRLAYSAHGDIFQFQDGFNFERAVNYRDALVKALTTNVYDVIVCNDVEAAFVCYQMGLHAHLKIALYIHEPNSINPDLPAGNHRKCYYEFITKMTQWQEITSYVQTQKNLEKLAESTSDLNVEVCQCPLIDSDDLNIAEKEGLLFIGRHEDRKGPADYISTLRQIKERYGVELQANVITRESHVKKWEADFKAIGHKKYHIVAEVTGEAKARVIQSSKVAFMPYKNESYGIAVLEALRFMPTVVLDCYEWHYNFTEFSNFIATSREAMADVIWDAYQNKTSNVAEVQREYAEFHAEFVEGVTRMIATNKTTDRQKEPSHRLYQYLKSKAGEYVNIEDFYKTQNDKGVIYLTSDIETLYTVQPWVKILQTEDGTYFGIADAKNEIQMPQPKKKVINRFFNIR